MSEFESAAPEIAPEAGVSAMVAIVDEVIEKPESFGLDKTSSAYKLTEGQIEVTLGSSGSNDAFLQIRRGDVEENFLRPRTIHQDYIWGELKGVAEAHVVVHDGRHVHS